MFKNKKKLSSKVKYQSSRFKNKLARARTYQRHPGGWSKFVRQLRSLRWSFRGWLLVVFACVFVCSALYVVFYPNWFFVRGVAVVGARVALEQELQGQISRYLTQRRFFIPHKNLLFLSTEDLRAYVLAVNPDVWRIEEVRKRWPHSLIVRVVPRDPAFTVTTGEGVWLVSNDGLTLPGTSEPVNTLPITAVGLKNPELGKSYFSGNLLTTLMAVKKDFAALTGLPNPTQAVLKPVILDTYVQGALGASNTTSPATQSVGAIESQSSKPVVSDLMPEEVLVQVPGSGQVSAFGVLLQVAGNFDEVFRQLQVLISKQSPDRLQHLSYIDMRFPGKAFICLQNTPCAQAVGTTPSMPTPTQQP